MIMDDAAYPVTRDIVLVGGGHSHVGVLRRFAMQPMPGVRLTLICTDTHTPYSGMLPGYIAGHYAFDDVHIDLRRLAAFAGARFLRDEVTGLDLAARRVSCRQRPPLRYDRLSINVGSTPDARITPGAAEHAVPVKPIRSFNERWLALLARVRRHAGRMTIAVVGAGAGGVELTLAMQYRLCNELRASGRAPEDELVFHLFSADAQILPTHNARVRRSFEQVLASRAVIVHRGTEVASVEAGCLTTRRGEVIEADEIVWVTQAGGAPWLRDTGLALDAAGFIEVRDTLQTVTDPHVFAAGDCAAMVDSPLEKAGVFAVRQGRPLAQNLRRSLLGQPLRRYRPQARWLALISTGDRHAVASRGRFHARGDWVWRWKDWIDRRFMARFTDLPSMPAGTAPSSAAMPLDDADIAQASSAQAMRCGGCGAKVGAGVLSRALAGLHPIERDDVLIGLGESDDAAILRVPPGKALVHSVDFFRAFIDDPWLFGRIAANHALGDIHAMGAEPQSATAIVTIPPGLDRMVEETLTQMLTGAVELLDAAGCALVGGHTGEGRELALGFAVNGLIDADLSGAMRKSGMCPGDVLILTKPVGTGTLLAANALGRASGRWVDAALESMWQPSGAAAHCLAAHGATACTDVTGFGLLGHLLEMLRASGVAAEIDLAALPVMDGAAACCAAGMVSSLQAANVRLGAEVANLALGASHPNFPLLFDPQTAGGLLASVPADRADACLSMLRASGYHRAMCIGKVRPAGDASAPVWLKA